MKRAAVFLMLACAFLSAVPSAQAQTQTGLPPFGSFSGGPVDTINNNNLNVHITVPVFQRGGRGIAFDYYLTYDSLIWTPVASGSTTSWHVATNSNWGWNSSIVRGGHTTVAEVVEDGPCGVEPNKGEKTSITYTGWTYVDGVGTPHPFAGSSSDVTVVPPNTPDCGFVGETGFTATTSDGSGYTITVDGGTVTSLLASDGSIINPVTGAVKVQDSNGNEISSTTSSGITTYTDTLGTTALTISGTNPVLYTYTAPSGGTPSYQVNYTSYTVATNFGVSGINEFGAKAESLVSSISLPDGSQYTFMYEQTPTTPSTGACTPLSGTYSANCVTARIASITLPTGGKISYAYSGGNNGILSDGSVATLIRTTPDGQWTYAHSENGANSTTVITDPAKDQTSMSFQSGLLSVDSISQYVNGTQTLLQTVGVCYNGTSCPSPTLPISETTTTVTWQPSQLSSQTNIFFNALGLPTEEDEYDYANGRQGNLLRKTLVSYASLGNNIDSRPASITVENGSGTVAQTTYQYDQTSLVAPPGTTPQHVSISGARGNATTISYLVAGSTYLSKTFTYYNTGNVDIATDVNNAQTTYNYANATATCGNAFPTGITEPIVVGGSNLSQSMAWNCAGAVPTSVADENGNTTSTSYSDPDFWQPASSTDAENNVTNYKYAGENSAEGSLVFNSNGSTADILTTLDGLGRTLITQKKQSPSATMYDSVETDYDSLGRPCRTTVPYSASAGLTDGMPTCSSSSVPATLTGYDALNRPSQIEDGGGGTVGLSYTSNDVLQTIGPAPAGENTKQRQSEYNGIGQLTSVCEVTSLSGSGTCAQNTVATGYWTKYTYDVLGDLLTVKQNAQSSSTQPRTYTYDGLGRMLSETNPETGTKYYFYDSDPRTKGGANCSGTYDSDLVKRVDAAGNVTCYTYDALHRVTSTTYPYGPNSSNTPNKCFVYDAAIDSKTVTNAKGRLAEAYTTTSACSNTTLPTTITDEAFNYTVRGEAQDLYESTPHSGGYYRVTQGYWANGALNTISDFSSLPTITYGADGEGRTSTVFASSGTNPVPTATSYNIASEPTQVNLGSGDNDAFQYDSVFRMKQYQFNINGQSDTGTLTWNPNWSLGKLAINDALNSSDTQTCTYSHDDLQRIANANCGSVFSGTYTYDAFGNLTKSGTYSFQPNYSSSTNKMTSIGSFTPTYDSNGDVTNDNLNTYAWDVETRPTTIDGIGITYDALERMVEQNSSGSYSQIVWSPTGIKLGYMSGQTFVQGNVPLPGGIVVPYNSNGIIGYQHMDWLGNYRLLSLPNRTVYSDTAYGPFGETYAQSGSAVDYAFTGQHEDTVSSAYDFLYREYGAQGRWPSPDPSGIAAADPSNPQSWNRYAYALNSPLSLTDPMGLDSECIVTYNMSLELLEDGNFYEVISDINVLSCFDFLSNQPTRRPSGGGTPKAPAKLVFPYNACAQQLNFFDDVGLFGAFSSAGTLLEKGVEEAFPHTVQELSSTTVSNLRQTLSSSAVANGIDPAQLPGAALDLPSPGPLISQMAGATALETSAAVLGRASTVITLGGTAISLVGRAACYQLAHESF